MKYALAIALAMTGCGRLDKLLPPAKAVHCYRYEIVFNMRDYDVTDHVEFVSGFVQYRSRNQGQLITTNRATVRDNEDGQGWCEEDQ